MVTPLTRPASVAIILNAGAGTSDKERDRQRLAHLFHAHGWDAQIWIAASGWEVVELAHYAKHTGHPIVVAGGGDGTANAVASVLVDTGIALGVLPLGTLNHFARDLHIPFDLEAAAYSIMEGHVVTVDVGEVNGQIFLNNSSLGLYPNIVRYRAIQQQRLGLGKWPAFLWATFMVLRRYPFLHLRINTEGKDIERRTPFVFVGNNVYQIERLNIGTRARLDAGWLSLYWTRRTGRLGLLRLALRALLGRLHEAKDFEALCTKEAWIETRRRRLRVATDGEVSVMPTPLHYRVRAGALRVIAPPPGRR